MSLLALNNLDLIEVERELASRSLVEFIKMAWPILEPSKEYIDNWHVGAVCDHLEAVTRGDIIRLLINIPPGCMKSLVVSVFWPAWEWGPVGTPGLSYTTASHGRDLAIRDSRKMRQLIQSEWYQERWPIALSGDQNAKLKYENSDLGFRQACAMVSLTGNRSDRLAIDDPHNIEGGLSPAKRETDLREFRQTAPTRLNNPMKSALVVIMQRIHQLDVSGYIMESGLDYVHLMLPMEFDPSRACSTSIGFKDPRTKEGELLFPELFPQAAVDELKISLGRTGTAGQLQQSPMPAGGAMVKLTDFGRFKEAPANPDKITISMDTAIKDAQLNDPSVALVFYTYKNNHYLVDIWKDRVVYPDLKSTTLNLLAKYKPNELLVEDKGSGQQLIQDLRRDTSWPVIPSEPAGIDKQTRFSNETPQIESGNIFLPEEAEWLYDFEQEVMMFPNSTHDDQVDALSQFLKRVRKGSNTLAW